MQSEERGKIDEAESWRVCLREESENILPKARRLPVHGQAMHIARAQGQEIKPFIISTLFYNTVWLRHFDTIGIPTAAAVRN